MKILRLLLLSTLLAATAAWAQSPVYTIGVDGLSCPFCAYGIEKQLGKLDGVDQVKVDIEKGVVVVTMTDGNTLTDDQLKAAIERAGFNPRSIEQSQGEGQ